MFHADYFRSPIWRAFPLAMCGKRWSRIYIYAFTSEQTYMMKWISSWVSFSRVGGKISILYLIFVQWFVMQGLPSIWLTLSFHGTVSCQLMLMYFQVCVRVFLKLLNNSHVHMVNTTRWLTRIFIDYYSSYRC